MDERKRTARGLLDGPAASSTFLPPLARAQVAAQYPVVCTQRSHRISLDLCVYPGEG
jgi:hypothetical protein